MPKSLELILSRLARGVAKYYASMILGSQMRLTKYVMIIAVASEDYTTWLPELAASDALRPFDRMATRAVHRVGGTRACTEDSTIREYRQVVIPQRTHISAAAEAGRIAGVNANGNAV